MDWLITAVAISLLCVAAWLLWKRYSNRFKSEPEYEYYGEEEETPETQEAQGEAPRAPSPQEATPLPEPKKEA